MFHHIFVYFSLWNFMPISLPSTNSLHCPCRIGDFRKIMAKIKWKGRKNSLQGAVAFKKKMSKQCHCAHRSTLWISWTNTQKIIRRFWPVLSLTILLAITHEEHQGIFHNWGPHFGPSRRCKKEKSNSSLWHECSSWATFDYGKMSPVAVKGRFGN